MGIKEIPTRIIEPPYFKVGSKGRKTMFLMTDIGEMTITDAAKSRKLKVMTLYTRLRNFRYDRPDIFDEKIQVGEPRQPSVNKNELERLSYRDRSYKLHNIKLGMWELEQLQGAAA